MALSLQTCQCPAGDLFVKAARIELDGKGNKKETVLCSGLSARQAITAGPSKGADVVEGADEADEA